MKYGIYKTCQCETMWHHAKKSIKRPKRPTSMFLYREVSYVSPSYAILRLMTKLKWRSLKKRYQALFKLGRLRHNLPPFAYKDWNFKFLPTLNLADKWLFIHTWFFKILTSLPLPFLCKEGWTYEKKQCCAQQLWLGYTVKGGECDGRGIYLAVWVWHLHWSSGNFYVQGLSRGGG